MRGNSDWLIEVEFYSNLQLTKWWTFSFILFAVCDFKFRLKCQQDKEALTSCKERGERAGELLANEEDDVVDTNMRDVSANHNERDERRQELHAKDNGSCSSSSFLRLQSSDEFVEQQQRLLGNNCARLLSPFHLKTEPELQQQQEELEEDEAEAEAEQQQQELTLYEHFRDASAKDVHDLEHCLKLHEQNGEW